jgi:APA family basic amino acid/polyamine antiporter
MIASLALETQLSALAWMIIGLAIYFGYSRLHSKLGKMGDVLPKASDFEDRK